MRPSDGLAECRPITGGRVPGPWRGRIRGVASERAPDADGRDGKLLGRDSANTSPRPLTPGPPAADLPPPATDRDSVPTFRVRRARTSDVPGIAGFVNAYAQERILLAKERVTLYEDVQEFRVAEAVWPGQGIGGIDRCELIGFGALHVMWQDLAEVRTVAVAPAWRGRGVGHLLLESLLQQARDLGVGRLFCLTFEVGFFSRHGFHAVSGAPVSADVFAQLVRSLDEGVAEFLDLARVKPNTLGNTRMIREL